MRTSPTGLGGVLALTLLLGVAGPGAAAGPGQAQGEDLRKELEALRKENEVLRQSLRALADEREKLAAEKTRFRLDLERARRDRDAARAELARERDRAREGEARLRDVEKLLLAERQRIQQENKALTQATGDRDRRILDLTEQMNKARDEAIKATVERDLSRRRVEELTLRLRELEKRPAPAGDAGPPSRVGSRPNPPKASVKGVIEKVNPADRTQVQINLGSDAGLTVGHTLEVYRLQPQPQYLGMIRIVSVEAHAAVGRLVAPPGGRQTELRPGDQVASRLTAP